MVKKIAFAIAAFVVFLAVIELAARVVEQSVTREAEKETVPRGWQAEFFSSLFDWNEPDPDLLWRFKANLNNSLIRTNSHHLMGDDVTIDKPPNAFRILLLGDSSPVGLGLDSYKLTFGELVRYQLELKLEDSISVELVNAAVSGYTSEQIVAFLKLRGWDYQPDVVILYCGNNDASISGAYSDLELMETQRLKPLRRALSHLAAYRLLTAALAREYLDSALQADYFSLRIKRAYLDKLDDVATGDNIYLITLDDIFAQNGGERLFIGHCHPTEHGHGLITREIIRVLSDIVLR